MDRPHRPHRPAPTPSSAAFGGLAGLALGLVVSLTAGTANGFSFEEYTTAALADALERACITYANRPIWEQLVRHGMQEDWSWHHSAEEYSRLYAHTLAGSAHPVG